MSNTEDKLRRRKLKAEAELAEIKLAEAKAEANKPHWERCLACGGRRGHYEHVGGYHRSGIGGKRVFFACRACGGRGRELVYPNP